MHKIITEGIGLQIKQLYTRQNVYLCLIIRPSFVPSSPIIILIEVRIWAATGPGIDEP